MPKTPSKKYLKEVVKVQAGPTSYATGGFTISVPELESIQWAHVVPDRTQLIEANKTVYGLRVSWSGNTITVVVRTIDVTATTPAWAELASETNLSTVNFHVLAKGY